MNNLFIVFAILLTAHVAFTQSVGVGTQTPDPSAALDVSSTNKGMLVPRLSSAQRTTISNPATGLLVFDTNTNSFWFNGGTTWVELIDSTNNLVHPNGPDIYMGMTGNVGVGTNAPAQKLHVQGSTVISDNLGIGVTSPNAQLQTSNTTVNRKIVLYESANDDNQFYGFGVNPGALRYQVSGTANDHIFYASTSPTLSNQLMRIKGNGNVGVGNMNPIHRLDVATGTRTGTHPAFQQALYVTGPLGAADNGVEFRHSNGTQGIGFGYNTIYAAGSDVDQSVGLQAKGATGVVFARTNGAERLRINGSGNVGIANMDPQNKLDVQNGARTGTHPAGLPMYVTGNISAASNGVEIRHNDASQGIGIGMNTIYAAGSSANQDLGLQAKGATGNLMVKTNGTERMRITGNGDVGIGVAGPLATLEIKRGIAFEGALKVNGTTHPTHFNYAVDEHTYIRGGKAGSNLLLNDQPGLGNVGIGVMVNPQNKLDVTTGSRTGAHPTGLPLYITGNIGDSSNGVEIRHNNSTQGIGIGFNTIYAAGSDADNYLGLQAKGPNGSLFFRTNGSERMRISGNGNVGIGTGAPNAPLQFNNATANRKIVLKETANNDHQFNGFGSDSDGLRYQVNSTGDDHVFYAGTSPTASDTLMTIKGNGNVKVKGNVEMGYIQKSTSFNVGGNSSELINCDCPTGTVVVGGGYSQQPGNAYYFKILDSYPSSVTTWTIWILNTAPVAWGATVYAICARMAN